MVKDDLKEGDIIFIAIPNMLYRQVARGTGSKASHVGIVIKNRHNEWIVAESAVPLSKYSTYDDFLKRTENGWYCVRRLKTPITETQLKRIREECERRMGVLYHLGFKYHSGRLFCSKFVYDVYQSALGIEIGKLETFRDLFLKLPDTSLLFWRIWFFGLIPWSRVTITPASQMECDLLETIHESGPDH